MLRHLPWYALLRPTRLGDWPLVALHAVFLSLSGTMLLLAASPRGGRMWDLWGRCVPGMLFGILAPLASPLA